MLYVNDVRFHEEIDVSRLVNNIVREIGDAAALPDQDKLFIKRKLLRQVALRFVDEKIVELREKNPQADSDVITNDLFHAFKRIVKYADLEKCVQLDVENALKERVQDTFNKAKNAVIVSKKAAPVVPENTVPVSSAGLFNGGAARAALAAAPLQPDNKTAAVHHRAS